MAQQARNQIAQRPQQSQIVNDFDDRGKKFTTFINGNAIKNLLSQSLGGPQAAAQVTSTLISQVSSNPKLQQCQPMTILAAALRGEVGMGLSLVLGDYAIIPYKDQASFQLQVNGLKRLCLNSKAYAKIDCFDVREGEFKGRDRVTREPIIEWIEDDDEREQLPIIGYYAFYKLNEQYNGFTSTIYWTRDKILRHADRYSKAFSMDKYNALLEGRITGWDAEKLRNGSPWYGQPDEEAHMKMCKKTVLKQLLSDGFAPKSTTIQQMIDADNAEERDDAPVIYGDQFDAMAQEAALAASREPQGIEAPRGGEITPPEQTPVKTASRASGGAKSKQTASAPAVSAPASNPIAPQAPRPAPAAAPTMPDFPNMDSEGLPFDFEDEDDPLA